MDKPLPHTISRYKDGVKQSREAMARQWSQYIVLNYAMDDGQVVDTLFENEAAYTHGMIAQLKSLMTGTVRAPFHVNKNLLQAKRVNVDSFRQIIKRLDEWYWAQVIPGFDISKYHCNTPQDDIQVVQEKNRTPPSLVCILASRLSWFNFVYGSYYQHNYWCDTQEHLDVYDAKKFYDDFQHHTVRRGVDHDYLMQLLPRALDMTYDYLETKDFIGKLQFKYQLPRILAEMNIVSSAGIRPGPVSQRLGEVDGNPIIGTVLGSKAIQLALAAKEHQAWVRYTLEGQIIPLENYNTIQLKFERKMAYAGNLVKLRKLRRKKREFYMPGPKHCIHSLWCSKERMLLERGKVINIGRNWWHGGALQMAQMLNYDVPGMMWFEADHDQYDKHINDWLLQLYVITGMHYYDLDRLSEEERFLFFRAFAELRFNITCKMTSHLMKDVWSIVEGTLYSGGPETSPAGSWVNLMMFSLFLVHVMTERPALAQPLRMAIKSRLIFIVIYGDDHLYSAPGKLAPYVGIDAFSVFLEKYFGAILRDQMSHMKFFTELDAFGGMTHIGPKFLKRHFIRGRPGELAVLPFKPLQETMPRLLAPKSSYAIDAILSSIGQAWDTQFTNPFSYNMILFFYRQHMKQVNLTHEEVLRAVDWKTASNRDLLRKNDLSIDHFKKFPDYEYCRRELHVYDQSKIDYIQNLRDRNLYAYEMSDCDE